MQTKHAVVLSVLAITLVFSTQNVGIVLASIRKLDVEGHRIAVLLYFASMAVSAFIVPWLHRQLSRKKSRRFPQLSLLQGLILLIGAGMALSHLLHTEGRNWLFIFRGACVGSLVPITIYLFFAKVPVRRQGLLLGLAIAIGELCWVLLLPVLRSELAVTAEPILVQYLHKLQTCLQISMVVATALATASPSVAFWSSANHPGDSEALKDRVKEHDQEYNREHSAENNKGLLYSQKLSKFALPGFLLLIIIFSLLNGLVGSLIFPKLNPRMHALENPHILSLFIIPLVGLVLDIHSNRGAKRMLIAVACLFTAAPALVFFTAGETHDALFSLLFIGRQTFFITMMVVIARQFGDKSYALPACCAVYIFQSLSYFANWAGKAIPADSPYALFLATLFLALLFAYMVTRLQWLPDLPDQINMPDANADVTDNREASRLRVDEFIRLHNLSIREVQVMEQLVQGRSTNEMVQNLNLKESTIRSYVNRVLKKTKTNSRLELVSVISTIKENKSS